MTPLSPDAPIRDDHLRFVCISDTHTQIEKRELDFVPQGDVLLHGGDFSNIGLPKDIKVFNDYLGQWQGTVVQFLIYHPLHSVAVPLFVKCSLSILPQFLSLFVKYSLSILSECSCLSNAASPFCHSSFVCQMQPLHSVTVCLFVKCNYLLSVTVYFFVKCNPYQSVTFQS